MIDLKNKKPLVKITEGIIIKSLRSRYTADSKYVLSNSYIFKHNWESDFFAVNRSGFAIEFEIKVSVSDFKNDKKKVDKHSILTTGKSIQGYEHNFRPNKFFYVVPINLIKVEDVPDYAGLMYYDEENQILEKVKDAPFIHKEKFVFEPLLCDKFYYQALSNRNENFRLKRKIDDLSKKYHHFDYDVIAKLKPKQMVKMVKENSYKDYRKWMIDFFESYSNTADKIVEAGLAVPDENAVIKPKEMFRTQPWMETHRILTLEEFKKL